MKFIKVLFFSLILLGFTACDDDDDAVVVIPSFTADLVQLNDSGASGIARVSLDGNLLTVSIQAQGMVPNQTHPQHIHGFEDSTQNSTCPPLSADEDGNGIISVGEGAPFYGGIRLALENFPTADATGTIDFFETFTLGQNDNPTVQQLGSLENRTIVLHGLNNDGQYVATIPVACGQLIRN